MPLRAKLLARDGSAPTDDRDLTGVGRLAFTPAEVATAAGLSRKAIYRAIETGELRAAKVCRGSRLLVPQEAVREWLDSHLVTPAVPLRPTADPAGSDADRPGALGEALGIRASDQSRWPGANPAPPPPSSKRRRDP